MNQSYEEPNYMGVFWALAALTIAELIAANLPQLGRFTIVTLLMVLAFTKAGMVALWYMHLKFEGRLLYVVCAAPILLVGVILGGTWIDVGRPAELEQLVGPALPRLVEPKAAVLQPTGGQEARPAQSAAPPAEAGK